MGAHSFFALSAPHGRWQAIWLRVGGRRLAEPGTGAMHNPAGRGPAACTCSASTAGRCGCAWILPASARLA